MKHYPSITKEIRHDIYIYLFQKIDGSNIRAEWNAKKGFYKFGTKNHLIDANSKPFGIAIDLIKNKYEADLSKIFNNEKWKNAICFFELWGASSFAGQHNFDEKLTVTLIDVNPYKKGILLPQDFIKHFQHLDTPKVLYEGLVDEKLFDLIKQSTLPEMTFEGVVAKGQESNGNIFMFKIKSKAWLEKLKIYCKGNEQLFSMLE